MWKFCSVIAVLSLLAPLAFAEDEVRFFNGYKHGWKTTSHQMAVSKAGEVIYVGFEKKGDKHLRQRYFNISSGENIIQYEDILNYEEQRKILNDEDIWPLYDRMFYGYLSAKGFGLVFHFYGKSDERLALIRGKRKKYSWTIGPEDTEYGVNSYFEYGTRRGFFRNGDFLIAGQEEPYVFIIPQKKLHWVIARENFFYAPMRYVATVWRKTPACPPIPFKEEVPPAEIDECLEAIFKSHPKGEFDVDFPDTPDYAAFTR